MSTIPVGQVFVTTGGYDANFADFFKVVGKTTKSVKLVKIGKKRVSVGQNCMEHGSVVADPSVTEGTVKTVGVRAYEYGGKTNVAVSVKSFNCIGQAAYPWGGQAISEYNYH